MFDKRVDPATGAAVSYSELVATYRKQYNRREIQDWGLTKFPFEPHERLNVFPMLFFWHLFLVHFFLRCRLLFLRIIGRHASEQRGSRRQRHLQRSGNLWRAPSQSRRPRPRQRQQPRMARRTTSQSPKPRPLQSQKPRRMIRHPGYRGCGALGTHVYLCLDMFIHVCAENAHTHAHNTHIHTYIHTYVRTYVRTYIHSYIHTYMHACMHTYIHTYILQHTYIHVYNTRCTYTYTHAHTCAHINIHAHTCIIHVGLNIFETSAPDLLGYYLYISVTFQHKLLEHLDHHQIISGWKSAAAFATPQLRDPTRLGFPWRAISMRGALWRVRHGELQNSFVVQPPGVFQWRSKLNALDSEVGSCEICELNFDRVCCALLDLLICCI